MVSSIASSIAIDLSTLTAPELVATLDYETRLSGKLATLVEQLPTFTALVESDPAVKVLEADIADIDEVQQAGKVVVDALETGL